MAGLSFGFRQSTAGSFDDNRSRFVPSSVYSYSGPGPEVEANFQPVQSIYEEEKSPEQEHGFSKINGLPAQYTPRTRTSDALNISDPVAMHLLTETALGDSKYFEVLSFEELEQLKRERTLLKTRIDTTRRKLSLEHKLRDAAQSLSRLYVNGSLGMNGHRREWAGSKSSNGSDMSTRAEDELAASNRKIDELEMELKNMETRLEDCQRRIMEHTAGILQMTHKGLKKNLRKLDLPRSPESMASPGYRSISGALLIDDFDERSLYPVPDYVNDFMTASPITPVFPRKSRAVQDAQGYEEMAGRLQEISTRMHETVLHSKTAGEIPRPPSLDGTDLAGKAGLQIQAYLAYLTESLGTLTASHQRINQESQNVHAQIRSILTDTDSVSRSPLLLQDEPSKEDNVASHLAFSTKVLEQLHSRVGTLIEQKDILTRQIQQQRELNSKTDAQRDARIFDLTEKLTASQKLNEESEKEAQESLEQISELMEQLDRARSDADSAGSKMDAQRDAQIKDLIEELAESQRLHAMKEEEAQQSQNQIVQLIEHLDRSKADMQLIEQQRGMNESKALEAEKSARKESEADLMARLESEQHAHTSLRADFVKAQNDFEIQAQLRIQELSDLTQAKEQADSQAKSIQAESERLMEQMAGIQTELTMAKAELDGAYGSRAQRAADASSNPVVQRQLDALRAKNAELQEELKDTLEDYEHMTKASIDYEKERDSLETSIDILRDKCESFEAQLTEERLKQLGTQQPSDPNESTSTTVLKNEFRKMIRASKAESMKALRVEQDERRRLEMIIRQMKKDMGFATPSKVTRTPSNLSASPMTPA